MEIKIGTVVVLKKSLLSFNLKSGSIGIVYELYPDFYNADMNGASIIFENGRYDGWSYEEQQIFLTPLVNIIKYSDYEFKNVAKVSNDYLNGYWNWDDIKLDVYADWLELRKNSADKSGHKLCYCGHISKCECADPCFTTFKELIERGAIILGDPKKGWH